MTRWVRDAENRVVQEVLADNTSRSVTYDPATSRVQQVTDAKGQTRAYTYNIDDTLAAITYGGALTSPTPNVTLAWDAIYRRLVSRADG